MTTPSTPSEGFRFEDPRQARIYRRLALVGPGPAAFYRDACILMGEQLLETTTHVVAHLLREIESSIRAVLVPIAPEADGEGTTNPNRHEAQIRQVLAALEVEDDDPIANAWLTLAGRDDISLHGRAHRRSLLHPRPADVEFQQFWDDTQSVLDVVLDRFEARYLAVFSTLDDLLTKDTPSGRDITRLKNTVPQNRTTLDYFFGRLQSPAWLTSLAENGFFEHPPGPDYDEDGEHFRLPRWAQAGYLVRMAEHAPEDVLKVIEQLPETSNPRTHEDCIDALLKLPPDLAVGLTHKVSEWLDGPLSHASLNLCGKVGQYVIHIASSENVDKAIALAKTLLVVLPDPRHAPAEDGQEYRLPPKPTSRFRDWDYQKALSGINAALGASSARQWLQVLSDLLQDALKHSTDNDSGDDAGFSYAWRPTIEDHGQNHPQDDIADLLVAAVRDQAQLIVEGDPASAGEIVKQLVDRGLKLFRRIAFHIVSVNAELLRNEFTERMINKSLYDDPDYHHEYYRALEESFPLLDEQDQERILGWMNQGEDRAKVQEYLKSLDNNPPSEQDVDDFIDRRRLKRLYPVRQHLAGEWKARFEELRRRFGDPEHPDFLTYSYGVSSGPTSPRDSAQLNSMSIDDIIEFLKDWTPCDSWLGPSPGGLSSALAAAVADEPDRYAVRAADFIGLDPTYVRAVIDGVSQAVKNGKPVEWAPVLDVAEWVLDQPRDMGQDEASGDDSDRDWGWTLKSIANLLGHGFGSEFSGLGIEHRERVWAILARLANDPDPTIETEARYTGDMPNLSNLSITTVRGEALHSVMRYALWVHRSLKSKNGMHDEAQPGLHEMSEVRELLEEHLVVASEPSLAIRSVYGQWFPWLVFLDSGWAAGRVKEIFPDEENQQDYWRASWDTYVGHNKPYEGCLLLLDAQYRRAIQEIKNTGSDDRTRYLDPGKQLVHHLMEFYWLGKIGLESGGLLQTFYALAPPWARAEAMDYVGRSICNTDGPLEADIAHRLKALWEFRRNERERRELDQREFDAFGWWFKSGKFDDEWSIVELRDVLDKAEGLRRLDTGLVIDRLVEVAPAFPGPALDCLIFLIEKDEEGWSLIGHDEEARAILSAALESGQDTVRKSAREYIHRAAARGDLRFRELVE